MNFKISGTGSAYPTSSKSNDDLSTFLDTSDEWISSRTGIKSRYVCTTETLAELASRAGKNALDLAGAEAADLDLIICATVCGDYLTPSLACLVQKELGASCPAFDVNAACSGFLYALDVAAGFFARGTAKKILVISAEAMSRLLDWTDRSTCVLFGDGAGAVLLEPGDGLLSIRITAHGNENALNIPSGTWDTPFSKLENQKAVLHMNGQDVYKFAVSSMFHDVQTVIEQAGLQQEDVDWVLPHQANLRIIATAKKQLNIPEERFCVNIERFGNTSSAGIPILMDEMNRAGKFKPGQILVLSAFGGGLTTGACVLRWAE